WPAATTSRSSRATTRATRASITRTSCLTQELFGRAYPSAWKIIRNRERQQQNGGAGQAKNAKDGVAGGVRTDKKKGAGRQDGGAAVENEATRALRLFDLAQFPSLK
ncbi:unnamed protein product, partial [Urochloa humidicola]